MPSGPVNTSDNIGGGGGTLERVASAARSVYNGVSAAWPFVKEAIELWGKGNYRLSKNVKRNSLYFGGHTPTFRGMGNGDTMLCRREYVTTLMTDTNPPGDIFWNYYLTPRNGSIALWGRNIAKMFQKWRPEGWLFIYKAMVSEYAAGAATPGFVGMAVNYDAAECACQSKLIFEEFDGALVFKASENAVFGVECAYEDQPFRDYYTYPPQAMSPPTTTTPTPSQREVAMGIMMFATFGCPTNTKIGEIWTTYNVRLLQPLLPWSGSIAPGTGEIESAAMTHVQVATPELGNVLAVPTTQKGPMGSNLTPLKVLVDDFHLAYTYVNGAWSVYTLDVAVGAIIEIAYLAVGASTVSALSWTITAISGLTPGPNIYGGGYQVQYPYPASTQNNVGTHCVFTVTAPKPTFSLDGSGSAKVPTSITTAELYVKMLAPGTQ